MGSKYSKYSTLEPIKKLDKRVISDITINNNVRKNLYSIDGYKFLIDYDFKDLNFILYKACILGSSDLALYVISKGANKYDIGLEGACQGGHLQLAKLMITYGADIKNYTTMSINLYEAALHGHIDILDYLLDLIETNEGKPLLSYYYHISESLYYNFNIRIFDYLVRLGYHNIENTLFNFACVKNSIELFKGLHILKFDINYDIFKYHACKSGSYDIVCYLMSLGVEFDYDCIKYAFLSGNIKLISMFIDIVDDISLQNIVFEIIKAGLTDILKTVLLLKNDVFIIINTSFTWTNYYICCKKNLTDDSFENLRTIQKFKNLRYLL